MEFEPTMITLPCQHISFCNDCAKLIAKRQKKCVICQTDTENIIPLVTFSDKYDHNPPLEISSVTKYLSSVETKSTFIKRANLIIGRIRNDLVISGNKVDGFLLDSSIPNIVFEYYLGTIYYNPNMYNVKSEYTGVKMTIRDGNIIKTEGLVKYTYPDFFNYVKEELVSEKKLSEHILDHYYLEYVLHTTKKE
jgi:hypothetical protein